MSCRISSPTRNRTRNFWLEARDDVRFTIEPLQTSGRRGSRTLITRSWHALAVRPGKPYPAAFRKLSQWTRRESNPSTDFARVSRRLGTCQPICFHQRSVRELNPVFVHTTDACCRNTYRPFASVITDGIEPSVSCLSHRRLSRWTTRSFCE